MSYVLSTMWMQHRFSRLRAFWEAIQALGFAGVEVSHVVRQEQVTDLRPGDLPIVSVHYPAPVQPSPFPQPADALLTSLDPEARAWAVEQGRRSLRFAAEMGARAVCLHLGAVEMPPHLEWALEQRFLGRQRRTPYYRELRDAIVAERARRRPPFLDAARRSLDELASLAGELGLRLGIESRRHYREIPTLDELGLLLDDQDPAVVGFWYDMGHVEVLHNLGYHLHQEWLNRFGERIVGVHIHDTLGLRDHLLPGLGELNFGHIANYLPEGAVRTLELDWYYTEEELVAALAFVQEKIG